MKLSIVIPVYNEEKTLKDIVSKVENFNDQNILKEIVLVNDASKDKSWEVIKTYKDKKGFIVLNHEVNKGKGGALKTGFEKATGDYAIVQDADLEYNPEDYTHLLEELNKGDYKVIYGSRFLGKPRNMKPLAFVANKVLTLITNVLYGQKLTDMETCYKLIPKEIYSKVDIKSMRFNFEPEITAKILKMGYKIKEVPISYNARKYDEGKKINWKDGIQAVIALIKFRFVN